MTERRKQLRNDATPQEKKLWIHLQGKKLGYKFIRQYSIDNYVVDFYCPSKRLAIELDGDIHKRTLEYDKYRTEYLKSFSINILRFQNIEVDTDIQSVIDRIMFSLID